MATRITIDEQKDLDLFDEDAQNIFDILPKPIKDAYLRVPEDVRALDDHELIKAMNKISEDPHKKGPGSRLEDRRRDIRLKHALWYEYDRAIIEKRKMNLVNIVKGIMPQPNFHKHYLADKLRVEWMMRPPLNYWNEMRVLLEKSTMGIHEILDIPVVRRVCRCHHMCLCGRKGGQFAKNPVEVVCKSKDACICPPIYDSKIAQIKQKLHESIELRVKGAVVQRVRVDKQHLIAQVKADQASTDSMNQDSSESIPQTSKDVDNELLKLRGEVKQLQASSSKGDTIDVTNSIQHEIRETEPSTQGDRTSKT